MVQPELKYLLCTDVDDLVTYRPRNEAFTLFVQAIVGPRGADGEESFGLNICSSDWVKQNCNEPMLGLHLLIVPSYNYDEIVHFVSKVVTSCQAETWHACALKLQRLGSWEFEDYDELRGGS